MNALIEEVLKKYNTNEIAKKMNLAPGTVKRWIELNNVPSSYQFDLMKLISKKIDYSNYTAKEKDQIFTPESTANKCYEIFCKKIKEMNENEKDFYYIEPSAGNGSFMSVLPKSRVIGMDIEPKREDIMMHDYLIWRPQDKKKYIVFGNPPFGLRGHLALQFINHSYEFADYVCFILPQLFDSDGKGVPRKRVIGFHLIHTEKIDSTFYDPENKETKINVVFQIWSKHNKNGDYELKETKTDSLLLKIYSLSDGGTPSSTRNKKMIELCDVYLPSTCFGKENMKCYDSFDKLPGRKGYGIVFHKNKDLMIEKSYNIDWGNISFSSTNSAFNLRASMIESQYL
jgi:hypothetical protein